ncbi:MAG: carbohydrate binding domain-containing protein, partial [Clostridium sp.]
KSLTDMGNKSIVFSYEGEKLKFITYPDKTVSTYNYDSNNNITLINYNDIDKMEYVYSDIAPYKIRVVREYGSNGAVGGELKFNYGNFETSLTDKKGRVESYQFNSFGRLTSITEPDGTGKTYEYEGKGSNISNKISLQSKLKKPVNNRVLNSSFEIGSSYWGVGNDGQSTSTIDTTTEAAYIGAVSMKMKKSNNGGRSYSQQFFEGDKGKDYILSAYVKVQDISKINNGGAGLLVHYKNKSGNWEEIQSKLINGSDDWQRVSIAFSIPIDASDGNIIIRNVITGESGTAYFDCMQLESGKVENRYNLVNNSEFSAGANNPFWKYSVQGMGNTSVEDGRNVFKVNGSTYENRHMWQDINISGKKGDAFVASSIVKAKSAALNTGSRSFCITLRFSLKDGTEQWESADFNHYTDSWQYLNKVFIAKGDYSSVGIYFNYNFNANIAYIDTMELYKEEFGVSYQYDSKGNIISSEDLAKTKSKFEYNDNNDLIKSVDAKGNEFKYQYYYGTRNIKSAITATNMTYNFEYDEYGNTTKATLGALDKGESIKNLLLNSSLEEGISNWSYENDSASLSNFTIETGDTFVGEKSIKGVKTNNIDRGYMQQYLSLEKGKTYTFSGYIKTSGITNTKNRGAALLVHYKDKNNNWVQAQSSTINGNKDWTRTTVTFTIPQDAVNGDFIARTVITEESGTAYFDGLVLNEGSAAADINIYKLENEINNRLSNSNFENNIVGWSHNDDNNSKTIFSSESKIKYLENKSLKAVKSNNVGRGYMQQILNLEKGKTYTFSGYVKTDGITNTKSGGA